MYEKRKGAFRSAYSLAPSRVRGEKELCLLTKMGTDKTDERNLLRMVGKKSCGSHARDNVFLRNQKGAVGKRVKFGNYTAKKKFERRGKTFGKGGKPSVVVCRRDCTGSGARRRMSKAKEAGDESTH